MGDSGEQDLELYADLARERPHQIAGIFIRNVTTPADVMSSIMCGMSYGSAGGGVTPPPVRGTLVNREPQQIREMPSMESLTSSISRHADEPPRLTRPQSYSNGMTPEERKVHDFVCRVEHARAEIPSYIVLKIFKEPFECESEMASILRRYR